MRTVSSQQPQGLPRWIELFLAAAALLLLLPVMLLIALAVRLGSPGPALFRQQRVGRHGVPFTLIKFRSMTTVQHDGASAVTAAGDRRVTRIGRLLRASKLDELPELWNIVRGDMSWVGPRPEVPRHVDLSQPGWSAVLQSRPGLTDPTTLLLRNEEALLLDLAESTGRSIDDVYRHNLLPLKVELSLRYLERRTAWSDIGILLRTLLAVLLPGTTPDLDELRSAGESGTSEDS